MTVQVPSKNDFMISYILGDTPESSQVKLYYQGLTWPICVFTAEEILVEDTNDLVMEITAIIEKSFPIRNLLEFSVEEQRKIFESLGERKIVVQQTEGKITNLFIQA